MSTEENQSAGERVHPWLAAGILITLAGIFVLGGVVAKRVYLDMPTPRTALERELVTHKTRLSRDPDDTGARVKLAQVYFRMGKIAAAQSQLEIVEQVDPGLWDVHFVRGMIALDQDQTGEAIKAFERAKKADPRNELAYYHVGVIYLEREQYELSVENLERAVKLNCCGLADAHYSLGLAYERLGKDGKAVEHYEHALEYVPSLREARTALKRLSD